MSDVSEETPRWQVIKEILADARDQPKTQRQKWLRQACGEDRELRFEIADFLALEDRLPGFIEEPILPLAGPHDTAEDDGEVPGGADGNVGRKIGPYRLVRLIAKGGMGAVYLAEREEEFEQRVALKLVRRRWVDRERVQRFHGRRRADRELIQRFHHERQILARLEHPNIARLLDGGTTEDGDPYFAMEWIQGVPIDDYCAQQRLSTRQRLGLILPVCSAIALAHQNLVVHRDLKPGNILVDTGGIPKLLDFGIAKLLDSGLGIDAAQDFARNSALTPRYASPEQLRGQVISTASDVYSLGVVLHELLTGRLPPPVTTLPDPLITTIDEMGGGPWNPDPAKVGLGTSPLLHGDLKAILNKALRPDPRERYSTVERLAADLQDHLEDRPVRARQGGQAYRAAKFLRRHRLGVVNTAIMVLLAIIFTLLLAGQLHETRRSRDQAQGLTDFLVDLFLTAAPDRPAGEEPTVRDLLDAGRDQLRDALKEQEPAARAKLLLRLGEIYTKWGEYEEARSLLEEAIEVLRAARVGPHPDLATALSDLATVDLQTGNLPAAEALYRESLEMRQSLGRDEDLIKPMNNLASILVAQGNLREAVPIYRQTLEIRRARLAASPDDPTAQHNLATSLRSLANALAELADLDAAEPLLRESLALRRRIYGPNSPMVATVEISLGRLEHARGHLPEADQWITRGLNTRVRELGEDHPHTAFARRDQASLRLDQGRSHEARELLRQALETLRQVRPEDDPEIAKAESLLGAALASEGEFEAAAIYLERGLEVLKRRRGLRAPDTLAAQRRRDQFLALKERAALPLGHGEALPQP